MPAGLRLQNVLPPHHHMHTPIPPQAVVKSGILAPGDPAHETLWMLNHREFPLHSVSLSDGGKGTLGWWWWWWLVSWLGLGSWMKFKCQEKIGREWRGERAGSGAWWCSATATTTTTIVLPHCLWPQPEKEQKPPPHPVHLGRVIVWGR